MRQYKTEYVKMTRDPARFAQNLEKKLNELESGGWTVFKSEYDAKKGMLIIAAKVSDAPVVMALPPDHPLMKILAGAGAPQEDDVDGPELSPVTERIINEILKRLGTPTETNLVKIPSIVEQVSRNTDVEALIHARDELRKVAPEHRARHVKKGEPQCPLTGLFEKVVEALDRHLRLSLT